MTWKYQRQYTSPQEMEGGLGLEEMKRCFITASQKSQYESNLPVC